MSVFNKFFFTVLVGVLTAGCAAKKPDLSPPYVDTPGQNATVWPKAGEEIPLGTPEIPAQKKDSIALVVGGAGVASFATIGLLKRFREEGVKIELIVATGWPVLFALGNGSMKSVHDLEWQAGRLVDRDFRRVCEWNPAEDDVPVGKISENLARFFSLSEIASSRVPVVISLSGSELGHGEIRDRGDWREPLVQALSFPGLYRDLVAPDDAWLRTIRGLDVEEALKRHRGPVVAVSMYEDFRRYLIGRSGSSDRQSLFTQGYIVALQKGLKHQLAQTPTVGQIELGVSPTDFSAKRAAIQAGYREAKRLSRLLQ